MINSLLELVVTLFIATVPILALILRTRRRRAARSRAARKGAPAAPRNEASKAETPKAGTAQTAAPTKRATTSRRGLKGRLSRLRRRFLSRRRPGGSAAAPEEEKPSTGAGVRYRRQGAETARSVAASSQIDEAATSATVGKEKASGAERLLGTVDRYPPLQRAILLKEILGPPKGL